MKIFMSESTNECLPYYLSISNSEFLCFTNQMLTIYVWYMKGHLYIFTSHLVDCWSCCVTSFSNSISLTLVFHQMEVEQNSYFITSSLVVSYVDTVRCQHSRYNSAMSPNINRTIIMTIEVTHQHHHHICSRL